MNIYYNRYDVIICGTSIIHDILAVLLRCEGKRVFYADRNRYYGGEGRSMDQLSELWNIFRSGQKLPNHLQGFIEREIDFIPKLILSNGKLVKIFSKTKIQKYLKLEGIDEYVIYHKDKNQEKIVKIPSLEINIQNNELLKEDQNINYYKFIEYVVNHDILNLQQEFDLDQISFRELAKEFKLDQQCVELLGKVLAFQLDDDYLNQPAKSTVGEIQQYLMSKNKNSSSPFIYPRQKPEDFVFKTLFMRHNHAKGGLETDISEILFDDKGQVYGVTSDFCKKKKFEGSAQIYAPIIIADPSYANYQQIKQSNRVNFIGKIIRCICILDHPLSGYDDKSLSIIIPTSQTGRKNDIYITMLKIPNELNYKKQQMYYACVISTNIETNDPEQELEAAFKVINPVLEKFITISDWYVQNEWKNNLYFTNSSNASNILDTEIEQVFEIYKYITGKNLDLNNQQDLQLKEGNYDVIILGTSIMHGILASLLTNEGKKVFYADSNHYLGGEARTIIDISNAWQIFRPGQQPTNQQLQQLHPFWGLDLIPKLILYDGKLINILANAKVLDHLRLKYIDENLIYNNDKNQEKILNVFIQTYKKIPSLLHNIQKNELLNEEQKINYLKFMEYVINYDNLNLQQEFNLNQINFGDLAKEFKLDQQCVELIGKVLAFQLNDDYLNQPASSTIEKIKFYLQSIKNNSPSPLVYPLGGIGRLLDKFSLSLNSQDCMTGSLFMDVKEILFDDKGQVSGIKSEQWKKITGYDQINAPIIVADPSYAKDIYQYKVTSIGKIIRCICLLNHTIPGYDDKSLSIIIPTSQTGRKNDIYITMLGYSHNCTDQQGYYVCYLSTNIETNDPEQELEAAFKVIDPVLEKFITISDWYVQNDWKNNLYFTNSQNASNILDTEIQQVLEVYKYITGKNLENKQKDWTFQ